MSETVLKIYRALLVTSKSLKAARLFRPCTLASLANTSRPCLFCHRFDEEEEFLVADCHSEDVYRCGCGISSAKARGDGLDWNMVKRALLSVKPVKDRLNSMKCHANISTE